MPPLPDMLEELDLLLAALPMADEAPLLTELDGFLAGTLIAPEPVPEAEWLPLIWSGEDGAPEGFAPPPRLIELAKARRAEIAGALFAGGLRYMPVYDYDSDDSAMWELWIEGFGRAMALWGEAWAEALESADEDLGAALMGLVMLLAVSRDAELDPDEGDELVAAAPDMIPYLVETVYRRRHGLPRVIMCEPAPASPKVGRNAPCTCGSGKKFKKCCAA